MTKQMIKNSLALVFYSLIFILPTLLNANAEIAKINEGLSKINYSLSCYGISFKKKDLPVKGDFEIESTPILQEPTSKFYILKKLNLITSFTSKNPLFRKVINYEKYPYIEFHSLVETPLILNNNEPFELEGLLTFHGVTKKTKIYLTCLTENNSILFTGSLDIPMTEFGVIPPKILFLKVDDLIKTKIELYTELTQ